MRLIVVLWLSFTSIALSQTIPPTGNFVYIDQIGDNNNITVIQQDSDRQRAAIINQGDGNVLAITQQGTGQHTASITNNSIATNNNNNILSIEQVGAGNHMASILLNNSAGASNNIATISQSGGVGANKQFTLELKGSQIGVSVIQDNPITPDSSSMSIQCLTPPCNGYSYSKR
jgi:hypothetical protein